MLVKLGGPAHFSDPQDAYQSLPPSHSRLRKHVLSESGETPSEACWVASLQHQHTER